MNAKKYMPILLIAIAWMPGSSWAETPTETAFRQAEDSARIAGYSLGKVQRWLHEVCLPAIDPKTGLYRDHGDKTDIFTYRDTAADCYPFVVWAAYLTDIDAFNGPMRGILDTEQRLCNHIGRIPVDYDLIKQQKAERTLEQAVFGASEYVKDGLVAIVELTGRNAWFDRYQGIIDDIFANANVDTPYGKIPSTNVEVNGDLLQALPRLYAMTGDTKYIDWAHRVADYYLKPGGFVPERLSDHGCEIIGGLGLLLATDSTASPEKHKEYEPHYRYMADQIILRGTNSDGIAVGDLQPTVGPHDTVVTRDGWGYDYVGFLDYDMTLPQPRYSNYIQFAMGNLLKPRYEHFNWDHNSRDNLADSVEGGLYLLQYLPVAAAFQWADREVAQTLADESDPNRLWEAQKLEANTVRTVLIHAMLHTRNAIARPWRGDLQLGASPIDGGIAIVMKAQEAYSGLLQFDIPRHREYLNFEKNWPRMNTMPEWFVVEKEKRYMLKDMASGTEVPYIGAQLAQGVSVTMEAGAAHQWTLCAEGETGR